MAGNMSTFLLLFSSLLITATGNNSRPNPTLIALPNSSSQYSDSDTPPPQIIPPQQWFHNLNNPHSNPKQTRLHFYVQDIITGDHKTVWKVAESQITASSPSSFGLVSMADNLLTSGPEPESEVVGRAQGLVGFADLQEIAIFMAVNIVFTEGKYRGSTIAILGRNMLSEETRELPIIGGTGVFRMARGIAVTDTTSSFDERKGRQVLEYTLYLTYY